MAAKRTNDANELSELPYIREIRLRTSAVESLDRYPFNLPVVRHLKKLKFHPKVTFFVGENGSGKSTLVEAIAVKFGFNAEGGSKHFNFSTRQSHSSLDSHLDLARSYRAPRDSYFLRAESYYNVATHIEELDKHNGGGAPIIDAYGGRSLHEQSHGESFLALFCNRLRGKGLYILDEPEAALSPMRQMSLLARLHQLVLQESQFIIATHSPIVLAYPDAWIYSLSDDGIRRIAYRNTENYFVMKEFINNPKIMLDELFNGS